MSNQYPFNLAFLKDLKKLKIHPEVTFFVGENGMGKSTLIEAIAVASGFNAEGGTKNFNFKTVIITFVIYSRMIECSCQLVF